MGEVTHILRHIHPERVKAISDHVYSVGCYTHAKEIDDLGHERDMLLQASKELQADYEVLTEKLRKLVSEWRKTSSELADIPKQYSLKVAYKNCAGQLESLYKWEAKPDENSKK